MSSLDFGGELKRVPTIEGVEALDDRVNRFIMNGRVGKVLSVHDTATAGCPEATTIGADPIYNLPGLDPGDRKRGRA